MEELLVINQETDNCKGKINPFVLNTTDNNMAL